MDITPLIPKGKKQIYKYGDNSFTINQDKFIGSLIITPDEVLSWKVNDPKDFSYQSIAFAIDIKPELIIFGCGNEHKILDSNIIHEFNKQSIPLETMKTNAACRTYNVLLSEGRNVLAALIAV